MGWGGGVPGPGGCTWSRGLYLVWVCMYLVQEGDVHGPRGCTWFQGCVPGPGGGGVCVPGPVGCVPGPRGVYLVLWGVYLVLGGVPSPMGVYLVGGCTWSRGCTWSWVLYLVLGVVPGPGGCTW